MDSTERIIEALEELRKGVARIDVTLAAQHVTLQEHIRRSLANEQAVDSLRKELKPVALHVAVVGGVAKAGLGVASVAGAVLAVLKALGKV